MVGAVQHGARAAGRPVAVASAGRAAESKFLSVPNDVRCADKLIENGDFERGPTAWRGDGKVVRLEDGNHVWEIKADKRRTRTVSQRIYLEDAPSITVKFRARALPGYQGLGLRLGFQKVPGGGSTFNDFALTGDGAWHDFEVTFARTRREDERDMNFNAQIGNGEVQLDDIATVTPKATTPAAERPRDVRPPASFKELDSQPIQGSVPANSLALLKKLNWPAGSVPASHRDLGERLSKGFWQWQVEPKNNAGKIWFETGGALLNASKEIMGAWRVDDTGRVEIRMGGRLINVWQLTDAGDGRFTGPGFEQAEGTVMTIQPGE